MSSLAPEVASVRPPSPRFSTSSSVGRAVRRATSQLRTFGQPKESSIDSRLSTDVLPELGSGSAQSLSVYQQRPPYNTPATSLPNVGGLSLASAVGAANEGVEPGVTTVHAGDNSKLFTMHTELLRKRSPYFAELLPITTEPPSMTPLAFPDLDEFAFDLFVRWMYGGLLHGPSDFHSMNHYICLFILAHRFRIERLRNTVVDLVRDYYRNQNMTAPANRLDYIYAKTSEPSHLRNFLTTTAAYRTLCGRETKPGQAMLVVIAKGGDFAVDFATAMASLSANGLVDVRRSPDCLFHDHFDTPRCNARKALEPYQNP